MRADHMARTNRAGAYPGALVSGDARVLDPAALGDHVDRLYRAAWALCGSREDAEDLVQDTFARVLARPRLLRNDDDLGYLLQVLRNTHISRLRASSRRPVSAPWPEDLEPADLRTSWDPETALDVTALFAAISQLPDDFRDTLVAVDVTGLSYSEAGRALGVPEATITTRLHRARRRAASLLSDQDVSPSAARKESGR